MNETFTVYEAEDMKEPTKKQQHFIDAYMETANAAEAARRAGYSWKNARIIGYQLARKPHIRRILKRRIKEEEEKRIAKAREVLIHLTAIMRGETLEPVTVTIRTGHGEESTVTIWKRPSARDRIRAAEALMRRYGLDMSDMEQEERAARVEAIRARNRRRAASHGENVVLIDDTADNMI